MLKPIYPLYLAGRPTSCASELVVLNKYTGAAASRVARADAAMFDVAIAAATAAFEQTRKLPNFKRSEILHHVARRAAERMEELAQVLCIEAGKPIRDARGEVARTIDTFRTAAEECPRLTGQTLPLDISPRAQGYEGFTKRFPVGPCGFITPFNFPLNLVAHKVAPAIAVGCPFVLKPASATPIGALILAEILAETEWPAAAFSVLPAAPQAAEPLITDERIKLISFTGSPQVGWAIKARAGKKKVALELGGNAACIIDEGVDPMRIVDRLIFGAFYQSGQSCISVQRILVHQGNYDLLRRSLAEKATSLKSGDPLSEDTFLGPMISQAEAMRVESWIQSAVASGAKLVCGGKRNGAFVEATLLENVDPSMEVSCQEVFGPVATLQPFSSFDEALRIANQSAYGLQAGVFTNRLDHALAAFEELEVGGVIINDVPSFRVDHMPYGGVKDSGLGREGVRYAMEEMTELRLMVVRRG